MILVNHLYFRAFKFTTVVLLRMLHFVTGLVFQDISEEHTDFIFSGFWGP